MAYKKTLTIGAIIIAFVAVMGIAAVSFASSGTTAAGNKSHWADKLQSIFPRNDSKRAAIDAALQKADYQAWLTAVGPDSQPAKIISAAKFPRLVEAYKLEQSARAQLTEAKKIREELGLQVTPGLKRKAGHLIGNEPGSPPPAIE